MSLFGKNEVVRHRDEHQPVCDQLVQQVDDVVACGVIKP